MKKGRENKLLEKRGDANEEVCGLHAIEKREIKSRKKERI